MKISCPFICLSKLINNQQITILSGQFLFLHSSNIVYYNYTHVATFSNSLLATFNCNYVLHTFSYIHYYHIHYIYS